MNKCKYKKKKMFGMTFHKEYKEKSPTEREHLGKTLKLINLKH